MSSFHYFNGIFFISFYTNWNGFLFELFGAIFISLNNPKVLFKNINICKFFTMKKSTRIIKKILK